MVFLSLHPKIFSRVIFLIFLLLVLTIYSLIVTHGNLNFNIKEEFSSTYTSMLDHFRAGDFDVDFRDIRGEAFLSRGHITTYQGPFLAFFRGVLEIFFERGARDWARVSCLIAGFLSALFLALCVWELISGFKSFYSKILATCLTLSFAFGSPLVVLLSNAYLYNEPILWGMAWTAIFFWALLKSLRETSPHAFSIYLIVQGAAAGFGLLSRASFGVSLVGTYGIYLLLILFKSFPSKSLIFKKDNHFLVGASLKKRVRLTSSSLLLFTVLFSVALTINYGRWGNPLTFMPAQNNIQFLSADGVTPNARGLRLLQNGAFNLKRFPLGLEYYFFPDTEVVTHRFPYLQFQYQNLNRAHLDTYDYVEGSRIPFSINSPFLFWFGVMGVLGLAGLLVFKRASLLDTFLILGPLIQLFLMVILSSTALRYQLDVLPFFVVGSLYFLLFWTHFGEKLSLFAKRVFMVFAVGVCVLGIYSSMTTMALAKVWCWATPAPIRAKLASYLELPADDPLRNYWQFYDIKGVLKPELK